MATDDTKKVCEAAHDANKFVYIVDLHGNLGTYFFYSQHQFFNLQSLNKQVLRKEKSLEDVREEFRKILVHCMQRGKHMIINLENTIPNLKRDYDTDELPLSKIVFNPEVIRKKSEYMKLVKDSENYDVTG